MTTRYKLRASRWDLKASRLLIAGGLLAGVCTAASAFSIGEINVQSHMGETFVARVNVSFAKGELLVDETCFSLVPNKGADGITGLPTASITFTPSKNGATLEIRTTEFVNEPTVQVILRAECPELGSYQREFVVLLDPPTLAIPLSPATSIESRSDATVKRGKSSQMATGTSVDVLTGDSVASIAKRIYPKNRTLRQKLIGAIMDANGLAGTRADAPLPVGTTLLIPRITSTAQPAPRMRTDSEVAKSGDETSPPKSRKRKPGRKSSSSVTARGSTDGGFRLKLSAPEIDLSHSETMTEQQRKELREQQLLMDSDDQVAGLRAARNKLHELEARIAVLQLKMSSLTAPRAAPVSPAPPVSQERLTTPSAPSTPLAPATPQESLAPSAPAVPSVSQVPSAPSTSSEPSTSSIPSQPPESSTPPVLASATAPALDRPAAITEQPTVPGGVQRSPLSQTILLYRRWLIFLIIVSILTFVVIRLRRRGAPAVPVRRYNLNEAANKTATKATKANVTTVRAETQTRPQEHHLGDTAPHPSMAPAATDPKALYRNLIINQFPELKTAGNTDARTIIGIAWKYFEDRGEHSRAIELVEYGLEEHPDVDELWLTQFEFLLRDRRASAYEQLAKRYRQRFPADQSWIKIQSWIQIQSGGRFLDPDNLLYAVEAVADSQAKVLSLDFDAGSKHEGVSKRSAGSESDAANALDWSRNRKE